MTPSVEINQSLAVAQAHLVDNVEQQVIARLVGVNQGRVSEICTAFRYTAENIKLVYELAIGKRKALIINRQSGGPAGVDSLLSGGVFQPSQQQGMQGYAQAQKFNQDKPF